MANEWPKRQCRDCDVQWQAEKPTGCWICGKRGTPVPPLILGGFMQWRAEDAVGAAM